MLSEQETKELVKTLLDLRTKLLWIIKQTPENEIQKKCIEEGKEQLYEVNNMLSDFGVKLPD
jgi:hypothetical protein